MEILFALIFLVAALLLLAGCLLGGICLGLAWFQWKRRSYGAPKLHNKYRGPRFRAPGYRPTV